MKQKRYNISILVHKVVEGYVEAKNEEEAKEKAFNWDEIKDETTEDEEIKEIISVEEEA